MMGPAKTMTPWIVPALVVAFYLVGSLYWGVRGAIICFFLPPAASFAALLLPTLRADNEGRPHLECSAGAGENSN
jgi:hypothetical protein